MVEATMQFQTLAGAAPPGRIALLGNPNCGKTALFNLLTGYAEPPQWKRLAVAPFGLQDKLIQLIERETQRAKAGEPARIVGKMNALTEAAVIRALYAASQAGVQIDLVVRGICCLRPGVPGVSERIRITSIVDRFLEHSRVFAFGVGERSEVFPAAAGDLEMIVGGRLGVDGEVVRANHHHGGGGLDGEGGALGHGGSGGYRVGSGGAVG